MKWQILFILYSFVVKCRSADPSNCAHYITINDPDNPHVWGTNVYFVTTPIGDNEKLDKQFPLTGLGSVVITYSGDTTEANYIDVTTDDRNLIFRTNAKFADIDEDTPKQPSRILTLKVTVQLQCVSSILLTPLSLGLTVIDVNDYAPEFSQDLYEYSMPMPLVPGVDLTSLGTEIVATDLDFSNQNVTFTVDSADDFWVLETHSTDDSKDYRAILRVNTLTQLAGEQTLTLTATDSGIPPLSSTATIKITIDETNTIPTFSSPYYAAKYTPSTDAETPDSVSLDQDLQVTEDANISIESDYFTLTFKDKWELELVKNLDPAILKKGKNIVLTIKASTTGADDAFATLLVTLPEVTSPLAFLAPHYSASYQVVEEDPILTFSGSTPITVNDPTDTVKVTIEEKSGSVFFALTQNEDYSWNIKPAQRLPASVLDVDLDYILTLKSSDPANPDGVDGYATLVVEFPTRPKFDQAYYTGIYTGDSDAASITLDKSITVDPEVNFELSFEDNYQDNFNIDLTTNPQITVAKPLDLDDPANQKAEILITLLVSLKDSKLFEKTVVALQLPNAN